MPNEICPNNPEHNLEDIACAELCGRSRML